MNYKKEILKKYTGKGGIVMDTIKEIPGTLKTMGKNFRKAVNPGNISIGKGIKKGLQWAGGQVEKEMKMNKAKDDEYRRQGENMMMGREEYKPLPKKIDKEKLGILKKSIKSGVGTRYPEMKPFKKTINN
jgi:hypothetical protein